VLDFGKFLSSDIAFSKELYDDLFFGISLNGAYGFDGDWGMGASTGVIYIPGDIWKLKNAELAATLAHVGYGYASSDRGFFDAIPENITPMAGVSFDLIDIENTNLRAFSTVSLPAISDIKLDAGATLSMGQGMSLTSSLSVDLVDIINGNYETAIPSVNLNFYFPLTPQGRVGNRLQTSELHIKAAGALLYDDVLATAAGVTMPFGVRDNNPPELEFDYPEEQYISPNYDGTQDELNLPLMVDDQRFIKGYILTITDEEGNVVRRFYNKDKRPENSSFNSLFQRLRTPEQSIPVPESFRWDGLTDTGEMASDGKYSLVLDIWDDNDNHQVSQAINFAIDATSPELTLEKPQGSDLIFSPDGDGNKEVFQLPQSGSPEDDWNGKILNNNGEVVRTFSWKEGTPEALSWDGTDQDGEVLPDGAYQYVVSTTDRAGNRVEDNLSNILINTVQPEIKLTIDNGYFSPGSATAINSIELGLDISTFNGLSQWNLDIIGQNNEVLQSWNNQNSDSLLSQGSLNYRGETLRSGYLPEGSYRARFTGKYQNGFTPEVYSPVFIADKIAPSATLSVSPRTFSPDGDGRQDEVIISQTSSQEELWTAVILDEENNPVMNYQWRGQVPGELKWNGQDKDGHIRTVEQPREYSYYLESTDQAGNFTRSDEIAFVFDNSSVEFLLSVDQSAFSPNGDRVKDVLNITMEKSGAASVDSYRLSLEDLNQREILIISEGNEPPRSLSWNGDDAPDGQYKLKMVLNYTRGSQSTVSSPNFEIDRVFPEITLSSSELLFSPNQDGRKDSIDFTQTSSLEELFEAQLTNAGGNIVSSWFWNGQLESFSWGGTDKSGNVLPNGTYGYQVSTVDKAGNRSEKSIEGIRIDNRRSDIFLTAKKEIFSPSGSAAFQTQQFSMISSLKEGIQSWELAIKHEDQGVIKRWSGNSVPPESFVWDGKNDSGEVVQGEYTAVAFIQYDKGDRPEVETAPFILDNSAPQVNLRLEPLPFSPDDDNVDDELVFSMAVRDYSPIQGWSMVISDPRGREFMSFSGLGQPTQRIIWDGRSNRGELVQSAEDYTYQLTISDIMGNSTTEDGTIPVDVLVVRDGNRLKILISNITFEPEKPQLTDDAKNMEVLTRIAEILVKYSRYRVVVEGHANPFLGTQAEKSVLLTLSQQRAQAVIDILVDLGVNEERLGAIGMGGQAILADPKNSEENWRNRRVEFILEK
jgi:outer membrane protein OmpA-like peptidoglycan-associated protein/flagellar hook assembly protein FlgD